ncbi:cyclase family protein [Paenarthrobacter sp. NPDC089316]|uniref:cyclase family protein n=1 Tax=unclassified Paenarthrobacter TaxID=2634190 RepID=UPI0034392967
MPTATSLSQCLVQGTTTVIDLTTPLSPSTPVVPVPAPFAPTAALSYTPVSDFDEAGPGWSWNDITLGEHAGTHVDAPRHWISGRNGKSVDQISPDRLVGPAAVVDCTDQVSENPAYLLTIEDLEAWETEYGRFQPGTWVLARTGWSERSADPEKFLDPQGWPGLTLSAAKWLAGHPHVSGYGVEAIGIDSLGGSQEADDQDPDPGAFGPGHYYLLGSDKYGVTSLRNLEQLPAHGATIIVAPLPLVGGTAAPARVFALLEESK